MNDGPFECEFCFTPYEKQYEAENCPCPEAVRDRRVAYQCDEYDRMRKE